MSGFSISTYHWVEALHAIHPPRDPKAQNFCGPFTGAGNLVKGALDSVGKPLTAHGNPLPSGLVRSHVSAEHEAGITRTIVSQFPGGTGSKIDHDSDGFKKLAGSDFGSLIYSVSHLMALGKLSASDPAVLEFGKIVEAAAHDEVFPDAFGTHNFKYTDRHDDVVQRCIALKSTLFAAAQKAYGDVDGIIAAIDAQFASPDLNLVLSAHAASGGKVDESAIAQLLAKARAEGDSGDLGRMIYELRKMSSLVDVGGAVEPGRADGVGDVPGAARPADRFRDCFHGCHNCDGFTEREAIRARESADRRYSEMLAHDREETFRAWARAWAGGGSFRTPSEASHSSASSTMGQNPDAALASLQKAIRSASALITDAAGGMDARGKEGLKDLALRLVSVEAELGNGGNPAELRPVVSQIKADIHVAVKENAYRAGATDLESASAEKAEALLNARRDAVDNAVLHGQSQAKVLAKFDPETAAAFSGELDELSTALAGATTLEQINEIGEEVIVLIRGVDAEVDAAIDASTAGAKADSAQAANDAFEGRRSLVGNDIAHGRSKANVLATLDADAAAGFMTRLDGAAVALADATDIAQINVVDSQVKAIGKALDSHLAAAIAAGAENLESASAEKAEALLNARRDAVDNAVLHGQSQAKVLAKFDPETAAAFSGELDELSTALAGATTLEQINKTGDGANRILERLNLALDEGIANAGPNSDSAAAQKRASDLLDQIEQLREDMASAVVPVATLDRFKDVLPQRDTTFAEYRGVISLKRNAIDEELHDCIASFQKKIAHMEGELYSIIRGASNSSKLGGLEAAVHAIRVEFREQTDAIWGQRDDLSVVGGLSNDSYIWTRLTKIEPVHNGNYARLANRNRRP
ncbi:hypothetical protein [Stenotrophomonas sp. B1-1]|uniref:hypothetical protein n=1 Tax=Stenotrophomonas sp. B1-1 TaxID=2710648 RepID=UPI0013DA2DFD|nr:hypothetical protein [Stenotrophomonas sp. B1-1]